MKAAASLLAVLVMFGPAARAQTAPAQESSPAQPAPAAAAPSPAAAPAPSLAVAAEGAGAVPARAAVPGAAEFAPSSAAAFAAGAKVFLEPMDGFEQLLSDSLGQKKVPVVLVKDRAAADFVMSGEVHLKKRGFITGMVLTTRGGANIAMKDARTGTQVFACNFHRVDSNERQGDIYLGWADQCAGHLKKALKGK